MPKFAAFSHTLFSLVLIPLLLQICIATPYNVVDFGAKADGNTYSTSAFVEAWTAACNSSKRSTTVLVPPGTFLVDSMTFNGPCKNRIKLRILGNIVAPNNYKSLSSHQAWIAFYRVNRLSVVGRGAIDAKGSSYWSCKMGGRDDCPYPARSLSLQSCDDVLVSGLRSLNSEAVHVHINGCNNVTIQRLKLIAPGDSPNTDGIHIGFSNLVRVLNTSVATGDDCISIGPGSTNMSMDRIKCGPGHGISIGSIGGNPIEDGVDNIVVTNSIFASTDNGVRIKTWAKPSNCYAKDIVFKNLIMRNVSNPIIIDQEYCPMKNCPNSSSGTRISDVTFSNIAGTSQTREAITLKCSSTKPCEGIRLQNINLSYIGEFKKQQPATSLCQNADVIRVGFVNPKC